MKIQSIRVENVVPGHKILYDNSSAKLSASGYPSTISSYANPKKTVGPDDTIYLVMDSKCIPYERYSSYYFKTIVLRSKTEPEGSYTSKGWGGDSDILVVDIDDEELALLKLQQ